MKTGVTEMAQYMEKLKPACLPGWPVVPSFRSKQQLQKKLTDLQVPDLILP